MAKKDSYKDYAHALYDATLNKKGAELSATIKAFISLLSERQKLKLAPRIFEEFERYTKKKNGIVTIRVTSAHELKDKTLEVIKKTFGDTVEATTKVEKALIGGVKVQSEDTIFDASLKAQLNNLKQTLLA